MVNKDAVHIVMGVLSSDSISWAIGQRLESFGARVAYTFQNERIKRLFFDRDKHLTDAARENIEFRFCDVTAEAEVKSVFQEFPKVAGVVHSIAYANPKTCLGEEFHTDAVDDLKAGFEISAASLATVARYSVPAMPDGGALVALTFDSQHAYPYYNWMGVNKAALEAVVRGLARRHGRDLVRVNAVSAGPLDTKAATSIPGYGELSKTWARISPLPWDTLGDKQAVADAVAFLVGPYSRKITGQVIHVDGGASIAGGEMLPFEGAKKYLNKDQHPS